MFESRAWTALQRKKVDESQEKSMSVTTPPYLEPEGRKDFDSLDFCGPAHVSADTSTSGDLVTVLQCLDIKYGKCVHILPFDDSIEGRSGICSASI